MASLRKRGKTWYFQFVDHDGKQKERKGCGDKRATQEMAREAEVHAARVRLGQVEPTPPNRTIEEQLGEYLGFLRARENTAKHVDQTETRLREIIAGVGATRLNDLDAVKIAAWLKEQRSPKRDPETGDPVPGMSAQTSNHYLRRIKSFVKWAVKHRRLAFDPVATLEPLNAKLDPRLPRSVLTAKEFESLIESTLASRVFRKMSGQDRAMLYITAAYTGLRASELARLTVVDIVIDERQARIRVQAAHTKNRRKADQPIHPHLAVLLRDYLKGKSGQVWPGPWWKRAAMILRTDLERAAIPYEDAQGRRDFHALRHRFGTELAKAGVVPAIGKSLMRHSSIALTMDLYADHMTADENARALGTLTLPIKDRFAVPLPFGSARQGPTTSDEDGVERQNPLLAELCKAVRETGLVGVGREQSGWVGREAPPGFEPGVEVLQTSEYRGLLDRGVILV